MTNGKPIEAFKRASARRLRANATEAERLLWRHLKRMETSGTHFRRQVPIGSYVVDFACMASRLLIELDGSHHGDQVNKARDQGRTAWLESEGYRVVRFWNNDIGENLEGVLDTIRAAIYGSRDVDPAPLKHLRRKRGRGQIVEATAEPVN